MLLYLVEYIYIYIYIIAKYLIRKQCFQNENHPYRDQE